MKQILNNRGKVIFKSATATNAVDLVTQALKDMVSLVNANLRYYSLEGMDFKYCWLNDADLSGANLGSANLSLCKLRNARFKDANLRDTNFNRAVLSGATGLPTAKEFLQQFRSTRSGIYVFKKIFGTTFSAPSRWVIKSGEYLTETVNPDRGTDCGSGVNFATEGWVESHYTESRKTELWSCLIEWPDVADIVVPYNTDGKARCSRLKLVKRIK